MTSRRTTKMALRPSVGSLFNSSTVITPCGDLPLSSSSLLCVYLLHSLVRPTAFYIGYAVGDPNRRLREHNSETGNAGAQQTHKYRPWEIVAFVSGFRTEHEAKSFEWTAQHLLLSNKNPDFIEAHELFRRLLSEVIISPNELPYAVVSFNLMVKTCLRRKHLSVTECAPVYRMILSVLPSHFVDPLVTVGAPSQNTNIQVSRRQRVLVKIIIDVDTGQETVVDETVKDVIDVDAVTDENADNCGATTARSRFVLYQKQYQLASFDSSSMTQDFTFWVLPSSASHPLPCLLLLGENGATTSDTYLLRAILTRRIGGCRFSDEMRCWVIPASQCSAALALLNELCPARMYDQLTLTANTAGFMCLSSSIRFSNGSLLRNASVDEMKSLPVRRDRSKSYLIHDKYQNYCLVLDPGMSLSLSQTVSDFLVDCVYGLRRADGKFFFAMPKRGCSVAWVRKCFRVLFWCANGMIM